MNYFEEEMKNRVARVKQSIQEQSHSTERLKIIISDYLVCNAITQEYYDELMLLLEPPETP